MTLSLALDPNAEWKSRKQYDLQDVKHNWEKTLCYPSYAVKMAYFHVDVTWFPIEDK